MSCKCEIQIADLTNQLNSYESKYAFLVGNTMVNYNYITKNIPLQSYNYNSLLYGIGNVQSGNISTTNNCNIIGNLNIRGNSFYFNSLQNSLGIQTSTPQYALDINGLANISGNIVVNRNTFYFNSVNNRLGINTTTPLHALDISSGGLATTGNIYSNFSTGGFCFNSNNNRLGILNANPQHTLDINGSANISGITSISDGSYFSNYLLSTYVDEISLYVLSVAGSATTFWTSRDIANATTGVGIIINGSYRDSTATTNMGFTRYIGIARAANSVAVIRSNVITGSDGSYITVTITGGSTAVNSVSLSIPANSGSNQRLCITVQAYYG